MQTLNPDELDDLVQELEEMRKKLGRKMMRYVDNPVWRLRQLRNDDINTLRDPRCWAAFTLTGYGFRPVYHLEQPT